MAETARFFDGVAYGEGDQAEVQSRMVADGVVRGVGGQLAVTSGGSGIASIATGEAFVQGFWYKNDAPKLLAVSSNGTPAARIDLVVLHLNRVSNILVAAIKEGVVGGGAPALTQIIGGIWEQPIASISTANGVSTYTDLRILPWLVYNPMSTAGDVIVGGASGAPTRVAKGANSRVFGVDASGVLGYHQVTSAMIVDGTIINNDLAPQTIRGGVDGATGRIVPSSLTNSDLAAQTIRGGVDGAASRIVPGSLNSQDIQDGSLVNSDLATQTIRGGVDGASSRIAPGTINSQDVGVGAAGIHGNRLWPGTVSANEITDLTITDNEIAVGSVHANRIRPGTIGSNELATGSVTNDEIQPNTIHPGRLTSWSGATYGLHVLYDVPGGGGVSVAKVQDSLCAVNSISGDKLIDGTITYAKFGTGQVGTIHYGDLTVTRAKIANRAVTDYQFSGWTHPSTIGAGTWAYLGGGFTVSGLTGQSVIVGVVTCSIQVGTATAIMYAGVAVDTTSGPSWWQSCTTSYNNQVMNITITYEYTATSTGHFINPLFMVNAGVFVMYGNAHHSLFVFHK